MAVRRPTYGELPGLLRKCLLTLESVRIDRLKRKIEQPILCGRPEAGLYFVYDGIEDPIIKACYEDAYPMKIVTVNQLHPAVYEVYLRVAFACDVDIVSPYSIALEELTQYDVKKVIGGL